MLYKIGAAGLMLCAAATSLRADSDVYLLEVPNYSWYAGCFGTACGNLMGFWDRHGFPDFYTGPTAGGVAPLDDSGGTGIRSMWASKSGFDGRPPDKPGHIDDYWVRYNNDFDYSYQSTRPDPYLTAGRPEHAPDCIGDFIGLSQKKWVNMNGECDGNIDAFSFVYWDTNGNRRVDYTETLPSGAPAPDIQSGLREWTKFRGSDAEVFTQLVDFNPRTPPGKGFIFEDVKREIDAGYPLLVFLQDYNEFSRAFTNDVPQMPRGNPEIHGMLVYGYQEYPDLGVNYVYCRTSWASPDGSYYAWTSHPWVPGANLSVRGVIGYRPRPKIHRIQRTGGEIMLAWQGPSALLHDALAQTTTPLHRYQVEKSNSLTGGTWMPVSTPTTELETTFASSEQRAFFRVRLLEPSE
jgi:hypothetical protein